MRKSESPSLPLEEDKVKIQDPFDIFLTELKSSLGQECLREHKNDDLVEKFKAIIEFIEKNQSYFRSKFREGNIVRVQKKSNLAFTVENREIRSQRLYGKIDFSFEFGPRHLEIFVKRKLEDKFIVGGTERIHKHAYTYHKGIWDLWLNGTSKEPSNNWIAQTINSKHVQTSYDGVPYETLKHGTRFSISGKKQQGDLWNFFQRDKKITNIETLFSITATAACSVAATHAQEIIHRDLKYENFLIADAKGLPVCKLADFGFAIKANSASNVKELKGTVFSPSQLLGYKVDENRSDLSISDHTKAIIKKVKDSLIQIKKSTTPSFKDDIYAFAHEFYVLFSEFLKENEKSLNSNVKAEITLLQNYFNKITETSPEKQPPMNELVEKIFETINKLKELAPNDKWEQLLEYCKEESSVSVQDSKERVSSMMPKNRIISRVLNKFEEEKTSEAIKLAEEIKNSIVDMEFKLGIFGGSEIKTETGRKRVPTGLAQIYQKTNTFLTKFEENKSHFRHIKNFYTEIKNVLYEQGKRRTSKEPGFCNWTRGQAAINVYTNEIEPKYYKLVEIHKELSKPDITLIPQTSTRPG